MVTVDGVGVLEIGGSHVTSALVCARRVERRRRQSLDPAAPADDLISTFAHAIAELAVPAATPWAVALPGPFDYAKGIGRYCGVGKFDSLNGVDLGAALRDALHPVRLDVQFLNDADAFAIGEWHSGGGRRAERCVGITLGSGVGSAFLAGGVPVTAAVGVPPDGEIHLTDIDGEPLENVVSRRAILARYRSRPGVDQRWDVKEIFDSARSGDRWAAEVLNAAFVRLGHALAPWLRAFGAELLVVGGAMTGGWDLIEPALAVGLPGDVVLCCSADAIGSALIGAATYRRWYA